MIRAITTVVLSVCFVVACTSRTGNTESSDENRHARHQVSSATGYADSVNNGLISKDTMKGSVQRLAMETIGNTHVHIVYSSPGVKGRIIWGGLVPYNTVWVTGAHTASTIILNKAIVIDDKTIEAGTYAIFTIPGVKEWIFILNKNHQQHLADDYSVNEDVLRFAVKPYENAMTQRLTYAVINQGNHDGSIEISWEKIKIVVPFRTAD
jgi:hypothetical protein